MNDLVYDYVRQKNDEILKEVMMERLFKELRSQRRPLRERFLLRVSDALLYIGLRIRPEEMQPLLCSTESNTIGYT